MSLPGFETCQMCMGTGGVRIPCALCQRGEPVHPHVCAECLGARQVPSRETVEPVAKAMHESVDAEVQEEPHETPWPWESVPIEIQRKQHRHARAVLLEYARHVQEGEK